MAVLSSQLRLTLVDQVSNRMRAITGSLSAFDRQRKAMMAPIMGMGGGLLALGGGYLAVTRGMGGTAGAAMDFESAMSDVRKVLEVSDEQFQNIRRQITGMSREMPVTAEGIAAIYAAAGQSGIAVEELGKFSEMVTKVSVAWETAEADTSEALAKIKNQLDLDVDGIALVADQINHIGNNSAAAAPDLVEFTKRVAANGKMLGFTEGQTLAFGGSMIAVGFEAEVAATSFRNMGRALTIGERATKSHSTAFKRLGLDSVRTAKDMQKDAIGTTLKVIDKLAELPEWERISIASALFGDEARALIPIIENSTELRRQLGLVGSQADYAGSAFREYVTRADTAANALQILRNKFADHFRSMGDNMLPGIKEGALAIGDVLDSLGSRVTPLKNLEAMFKGFTQGLGYDGSIKHMVNDLSDLLLGPVDPANGADRLGQLFEKFRQWGKSVREFNDAIRDNPIATFLAEMAGNGFKFVLAAAGIGMLAGVITKLGRALLFLSGASAAWGILKWLAKFRPPKLPGLFGDKPTPKVAPPGTDAKPAPGGKPKPGPWNSTSAPTATPRGPTGTPIYRPPVPSPIMDLPTSAPTATGWGAALKGFFGKGGLITTGLLAAGEWGIEAGLEAVNSRLYSPEQRQKANDALGGGGISSGGNLWRLMTESMNVQRTGAASSEDVNGVRAAIAEFGGAIGPAITNADDGSTMLPPIHAVPQKGELPDILRTQSVGTSEVRVINPPPPVHAPINVTVYSTTNATAQDIGRSVGGEVKAAVQSSYSEGYQ